MKLHEACDAVKDQTTFLVFARLLLADREAAANQHPKFPSIMEGPAAGGWENVFIETFLEAAIAWAEDSNFGVNQGLSPENPWGQFASFLYCGKIYE